MEAHVKRWLVLITFIFASTLLSACNEKTTAQLPAVSTVRSFDGSQIRYGVKGAGDVTLVFVHCWTCNHTFWTPQMDYFSADHKVVWLDLAGHGQSGTQRHTYTMQAFGQDVASVVNATDAEKVILIGHSMGGPVIVEAAKQLGDRVIGIVGVDTFYTPFPYPDSAQAINAFVKPFEDDFQTATEQLVRAMFLPQADPLLVNSVVAALTSANQQMAVSAMHEIFSWNMEQGKSSLALFKDKIRNINAAPTGKELPLDKSVVLIPKVGHFVAQVKPDEFNRVLSKMIMEFEKG